MMLLTTHIFKENMGNKYRASLAHLSGVNTFPQVFINGEFYGGAVRCAYFHIRKATLMLFYWLHNTSAYSRKPWHVPAYKSILTLNFLALVVCNAPRLMRAWGGRKALCSPSSNKPS